MPPSDVDAARTAARQAEAVRITRIFVPAYALATAVLFVPGVLRLGGVDLFPPGVFAIVGPLTLVAMTIGLVWWYLRLGGLDQWRPDGGPRFSILAAAFSGEYRSNEPTTPMPGRLGAASSSPLGILSVEVATCVAALTAVGEIELAASVETGLREAEALAGALILHERNANPERLAAARAATGAFEDHVVGLQRALGTGAPPEARVWSERLEADVTALRAAGDALRHRPESPTAPDPSE